MDQGDGNGPDASSLKPVSALRARFENSNKPSDTPPVAAKPPSRPISPAPKPDKLRDFKPMQDVAYQIPQTPSTPTIPSRPKERPKSTFAPITRPLEVDKPSPATVPPPLSAKPPTAAKPPVPTPLPPSVTVQPPQSPPKGRISSLAVGDTPAFLNPDAIALPTTPGGSSKSYGFPSRPTTPITAFAPPRSPRPGGRPPSPPPPRRSGEFKREKAAPPPPAPRRDRTLPALQITPNPTNGQQTPRRGDLSQETSPFNSPPGSPGADDYETPPQLPTRPRPEQSSQPKSALAGFDPPPTHHAVARRRDQGSETNGAASQNAYAPPQTTGPTSRSLSMNQTNNLPPGFAPRSKGLGQQNDTQATPAVAKRISSNPTTHSSPVLPARTHGRAQTVDRTSDRTPAEHRISPLPLVSTPRPAQPLAAKPSAEDAGHVATYPDSSSTNRRPPLLKKGVDEIATKYDPRIFDVCGELVCTSGQFTRVYNLINGDQLMSLAHSEGIKATAVAFKPGATVEEEGSRIWIGLSSGEVMEVDVATHAMTPSKGAVHGRHEVVKIFRHFNELWTMDDMGTLLVWGPDESGVPSLSRNPHQSYKLPRNHTFSMVVGDELWHATGKEIRVFLPTIDGRTQFQVLIRPLQAEGTGDVTAGTLVKTHSGKVFFGHTDGKISIYSRKDYSNIGVLNISTWKMNSMAGVGHRIWVGYNTGKICVYDLSETPWVILKEWQAHTNPVLAIKSDAAASYRLDRLHAISLGADSVVRAWDGLLEDDWLEDEMKSRDTTWCDFEEMRAMVFTWNAGASTPHSLRYSGNDGDFFPQLLKSSGSPEIMIFGFQELVDLEDKAATAKRFLKVKKKESDPQERMSHQYRDWRDYLIKTLDDYMPADDLYHLLHTAPMVGLFTCVFVKSSIRNRIRNLSGAEVKRGMGGLHGNKGAVTVRFQIDDTSLCFVNCHLAAGQSQTSARNNDIAEILEANLFPPEREPSLRMDTFQGGGDGTMVLDHELCIINGDLNYRIDTMSRDTVVTAVKQNNLGKLLDRDQLLVARRRNPGFRLRAFEELPITFAPTYKYDVGTDNYDTSEKRRSPAWCDRLLFRGRGRVQQWDYKRHEVRVSDHRPVTGSFSLWVKRVKARERAAAWMQSQQSFEAVREKELAHEKLHYLMHTCGYDDATSKKLIKDKPSRGPNRSPRA